MRKITPVGKVTTRIDPRTREALLTDGSTIWSTDSASNFDLFTTETSTGTSMLTKDTLVGAVIPIALASSSGALVG